MLKSNFVNGYCMGTALFQVNDLKGLSLLEAWDFDLKLIEENILPYYLESFFQSIMAYKGSLWNIPLHHS